MTTTLDPGDNYVVLINTFTVDPDRAEELCDLLARATAEVLSSCDGFVSANLHISLDRTRVANYAQWKSRELYEAVFQNEQVAAHMNQAAGVADAFDPILYELRHSYTAETSAASD